MPTSCGYFERAANINLLVTFSYYLLYDALYKEQRPTLAKTALVRGR